MAEFSGINKQFLLVLSITVLIKVRDCAIASAITVQAIFEVLGVVTMNTDQRLGETSTSLGVHLYQKTRRHISGNRNLSPPFRVTSPQDICRRLFFIILLICVDFPIGVQTNPLSPSSCACHQVLHFEILHSVYHCAYVYCMDFRTNSDYFSV